MKANRINASAVRGGSQPVLSPLRPSVSKPKPQGRSGLGDLVSRIEKGLKDFGMSGDQRPHHWRGMCGLPRGGSQPGSDINISVLKPRG